MWIYIALATLVAIIAGGFYIYRKYRIALMASLIIKLISTLSKSLNNNPNVGQRQMGNCLVLKTNHYGEEYNVYLTYHPQTIPRMKRYEFFLYVGGIRIPLKVHPGVHFVVTARDLGGNYIEVVNLETGETKTYPDYTIVTVN